MLINPRRFLEFRLALLAITALALATGAATFTWGQTPTQITPHDRELAQQMLLQVYDALKHNYYDRSFHGIDMDSRFKEYSAKIMSATTFQTAYREIESFLVGLNDSHTIFIPPPNSNRITYGFDIEMVGDRCLATRLRPNTDAAKKLHLGDEILSVDGYKVSREDLWQLEYYLRFLPPRRTTDFTLRDVSGKVRNESVTADLEPLPSRRPLSFSIYRMHAETRQHNIRSLSAEHGDVFLWKFVSFNEEAGSIEHMVDEARKHRALVLDLRDNAGGAQDRLLLVLGGLFGHNVTIGEKVTRKGSKPFFAKSRGRSAFTGPLIVLINSRSASASEILARVVQIEHRGTIIGDHSAGSVMSAEIFPFSPGIGNGYDYGAEITVADMIMADGESLEHIGVTPDEILLPSPDDLASGRDPVLARAAALAGATLDAAAAGKLFPFEWTSPEPLQ